jgi:hypothetical protein
MASKKLSLFLAFILGLRACQFLFETKVFYGKRLVHLGSIEWNYFSKNGCVSGFKK